MNQKKPRDLKAIQGFRHVPNRSYNASTELFLSNLIIPDRSDEKGRVPITDGLDGRSPKLDGCEATMERVLFVLPTGTEDKNVVVG